MGERAELPIHLFINLRWDDIKRTGISGIHNKKDEIISQAWLISQEIQDMRGRLIDFSSPNDQKTNS